jgi:copper chaperone NosL
MTRRPAAILLVGLPLALGACSRPPELSPPEIRYGEHECDRCRMLISDERFAAALVFADGRHVTKLAFDDINCVYSYLADHPVAAPLSVYTHDFESRAWLDARSATFVRSEKLETPMASQVAAAPSREAAARLLERYPGALLSIEEVARMFTPARASHADPGPTPENP